MIQHRLTTGRWDRLHPGVYRLAGHPSSWRQSLIVACLAWGPGSLASHRSAAALWRLSGFEPGPIELIVPRGRERSYRSIVHRPVSVASIDVTALDGIPVTTPARTLLDVAAVASSDVVEEALDDALRRRLVSLSRLRWRLLETGRRRRLDARHPISRVAQVLERWLGGRGTR